MFTRLFSSTQKRTHLILYSKTTINSNLELCKYKHFKEPWDQNKDLLNQPLFPSGPSRKNVISFCQKETLSTNTDCTTSRTYSETLPITNQGGNLLLKNNNKKTPPNVWRHQKKCNSCGKIAKEAFLSNKDGLCPMRKKKLNEVGWHLCPLRKSSMS